MKKYPKVNDEVYVPVMNGRDFELAKMRVCGILEDDRRAGQKYIFRVEGCGHLVFRYVDEIYESVDEFIADVPNHTAE